MKNPDVLDRVHTRVGVDGRYISLPMMEYEGMDTWGKVNDAWIRVATEIGEKALRRALASAGVQPQELDAIYFVSVTGIPGSPSIDARLVNRMGLPARIKRVPILGWVASRSPREFRAPPITCADSRTKRPRCFRWNCAR